MGSAASTSIATTATRIVSRARTLALIVRLFFRSPNHVYPILTGLVELDLPEYDSYETLRQRLYTAMTTGGEYFGFA